MITLEPNIMKRAQKDYKKTTTTKKYGESVAILYFQDLHFAIYALVKKPPKEGPFNDVSATSLQ